MTVKNTTDLHHLDPGSSALEEPASFRRPKNPVPGRDLAGTVVDVGAAVTRFNVGDAVFGVGSGSFEEYAVARPDGTTAGVTGPRWLFHLLGLRHRAAEIAFRTPGGLIVLQRRSATKADWPDALDPETGLFTYFGDNRRPGKELHETSRGGNAILRILNRARRHDARNSAGKT